MNLKQVSKHNHWFHIFPIVCIVTCVYLFIICFWFSYFQYTKNLPQNIHEDLDMSNVHMGFYTFNETNQPILSNWIYGFIPLFIISIIIFVIFTFWEIKNKVFKHKLAIFFYVPFIAFTIIFSWLTLFAYPQQFTYVYEGAVKVSYKNIFIIYLIDKNGIYQSYITSFGWIFLFAMFWMFWYQIKVSIAFGYEIAHKWGNKHLALAKISTKGTLEYKAFNIKTLSLINIFITLGYFIMFYLLFVFVNVFRFTDFSDYCYTYFDTVYIFLPFILLVLTSINILLHLYISKASKKEIYRKYWFDICGICLGGVLLFFSCCKLLNDYWYIYNEKPKKENIK